MGYMAGRGDTEVRSKCKGEGASMFLQSRVLSGTAELSGVPCVKELKFVHVQLTFRKIAIIQMCQLNVNEV